MKNTLQHSNSKHQESVIGIFIFPMSDGQTFETNTNSTLEKNTTELAYDEVSVR